MEEEKKKREERPFRFMELPLEIAFRILEYTELVAPSRELHWNRDMHYFIPPKKRKGNWTFPAKFFLLSREFAEVARRVFFRNHDIVVFVLSHGFSRTPPDDYLASCYFCSSMHHATATAFFERVLRHGSPPYLRYLELTWSSEYVSPRCVQGPQELLNFGNFLERARNEGVRLDNLRFIRLSDFGQDVENPVNLRKDLLSSPSHLKNLKNIRYFVQNYIWPMLQPINGPPLVPRQLLVDVGPDIRYSLRQRHEEHPEVHLRREEYSFRSIASQLVSWEPAKPDGVMGAGHWANNPENGEWVEEAWLKERFEGTHQLSPG